MSLISNRGLIDLNELSSTVTETLMNAVAKTKGKRAPIAVAVALLLLGRTLLKKNLPPKHLRHIPYVTFWTVIRNVVLLKMPIRTLFETMSGPLVESNDGLYLRPERTGWVVHVSHPQLVKQVFLKTDTFPKVPTQSLKGSMLIDFVGTSNILFQNIGPEWKKHRRLANPAFHRAMPVQLFGAAGLEMIDMLDEKYPGDTFTLDFHDLMERSTLDIIGRAGFDFEFNAIKDKHSKWKEVYDEIVLSYRNPLHVMFPILDQKYRWLIPGRRAEYKRMYEFRNMLEEVIDHKRQLLKENRDLGIEEAERDLLTLMLEGELRGEGALTKDELIGDLAIFFVAGHDTTANAMNSTIYWLCRHPEVQEKAREEINRVLCPEGPEPQYDIIPTLAQTKELFYVYQIMKESLRMSGPVNSLVTPRVAQDNLDFNGTLIPKGTLVSVNLFDLHHNPHVWKDPFVFNPDRFADGAEADINARNGLAWTPFSNGTRQCIGMQFSLAEQKVLLAMLLRRYEFSLPEGSIHAERFITNNHVVASPIDLNITFKRRF
ncbi:cytochrome P-450 cyp509A1 [Hesseltinella vesiculosa]|uniref:Cytochrome P-450 cyp509A1 n=1 Tax=Hesseltinella vesiculosa TaxID=101127 RepID=A0A1X2GK82_9FUNG|nr:cytochrome P-450 cyp509A1 [Hesseltinella vesiculosa]